VAARAAYTDRSLNVPEKHLPSDHEESGLTPNSGARPGERAFAAPEYDAGDGSAAAGGAQEDRTPPEPPIDGERAGKARSDQIADRGDDQIPDHGADLSMRSDQPEGSDQPARPQPDGDIAYTLFGRAGARPHDPPWRGTDVVLVLYVTLLALFFGAVVLRLAAALANEPSVAGAAATVPMLVLQTVIFAAGFGFAYLWIRGNYQVAFWHAIHWQAIPGRVVGGVIGLGVVLATSTEVTQHFLPVPRELPIERAFSPHTAWALALYGVAAAPFFEEFLFRGLIYPALKRSFAIGMTAADARRWVPYVIFGGLIVVLTVGSYLVGHRYAGLAERGERIILLAAAAVVVLSYPLMLLIATAFRALSRFNRAEALAVAATGILFGFTHGAQLGYAWSPLLLICVVGILFTWVRARTGSLVASFLAHSAYNATLFVQLYIATSGFHNFHSVIR
jgi:membrane protease YdiL (CAAX protease family)